MRATAKTSISAICFFLFFSLVAQGRMLKDIVYSRPGGVPLTLDANIPDGAGPFPAAVLVHGGGWVAGDKQEYITYIFQPLSHAGFAWFSINYRLAPQFQFPAPADDVEQAIRFVKAHAAEYNID
ncbi:MAG TPA: alpha/beta hydrolase, partial [Terriglobales bacterium]|nr:alpha/beta hydrolase [Terriglobales bacterium]